MQGDPTHSGRMTELRHTEHSPQGSPGLLQPSLRAVGRGSKTCSASRVQHAFPKAATLLFPFPPFSGALCHGLAITVMLLHCCRDKTPTDAFHAVLCGHVRAALGTEHKPREPHPQHEVFNYSSGGQWTGFESLHEPRYLGLPCFAHPKQEHAGLRTAQS